MTCSKPLKDPGRLGWKTHLYLSLSAIGAMLICTKSSPLYPINDWGDANCFFTVGKTIANGSVLYRDIYEQKGPLLYALHSLAWMISHDTFLGVWLLEILACYVHLVCAYRILCLFSKENPIGWMPIYAAVVYSSASMCHGDSVEELCLPLLCYALFVALSALQEDRNIRRHEYFLIGLTSGAVLWMKYTILAFYIGWVILPAFRLIQKKQWKELGSMVLLILAGVVTISVPVFVYFLWYGAIGDLWKVYFYNNIFVYGNSWLTPLDKILLPIHQMLKSALAFGLMLLGGIWLLWKRQYAATLEVVFSGGIFLLALVLTGAPYNYYTFGLLFFSIFGFCALQNLFSAVKGKIFHDRSKCRKYLCLTLSLVCMVAISYMRTGNRYLLLEKRENTPQYQFAEVINTCENPTLLNYGFLDGGFYTASGIYPQWKYFCKMNIVLPEMYAEQDNIVDNGLSEFVVTRNKQYDWPLYEQVAESSIYFEEKIYDYYLYQRRPT